MKKELKNILIEPDRSVFPKKFQMFLRDAPIYDRSSSKSTSVWFVDRDDGYFLKQGSHKSLENESNMGCWLHKYGFAPEVLFYTPGDPDRLFCRRAPGNDATHEMYCSDPARLSALLGELLRSLHDEMPVGDCPVGSVLPHYIERVRTNHNFLRYQASYFSDYGKLTINDIWQIARGGMMHLNCDTVIHGDYCLPNIILKDWSLGGLVDLGGAGLGDRHMDLFWGAWSLHYNLGTDQYRDRFFDAYGRDRIDLDALRVVAACEVFG